MSWFNSYARELAGGACGSAAFAYTYLGVTAPAMFPFSELVIPAGIGLITTLGFQTALPRKRVLADKFENISLESGLSSQDVANVIGEANTKIERIDQASQNLKDNNTRKKVNNISNLATQIIEGFIEDPSDIRRSRTFLNQYLNQTADLVERYVQLERKDDSVEKVKEIKSKFGETLNEIEAAFKKQYERNLSDDVLNLDVDMDVLNKMLKQEGL